MTEYPQLFRTIIALLKFDDVPPIPAIGYAANAVDDEKVIYFACTIERMGYAWERVAKWEYLDKVAPRYVVPYWKGNGKDDGEK